MRDLLISLAHEIGLSGKRIEALPPDAGEITVLKSDQLSAAQDAVQVTRALSRWLLVLVIGLYFAAAWLAKGYRRVTVRSIGFALIGLGLLLLVVRKLLGNYVIDAVTSPEYRGTGHRIWLIGTSILGDIGWASVFYGAVFVVAMVLGGGTRVARSIRRQLAPYLIDEPVFAWSGAAGIVLLLVLWGGTHALRTWWGILFAAVLIAIGVAALQRQVRAEAEAPTEELPAARAETPALT
jgi:hypothetical protein